MNREDKQYFSARDKFLIIMEEVLKGGYDNAFPDGSKKF